MENKYLIKNNQNNDDVTIDNLCDILVKVIKENNKDYEESIKEKSYGIME